MSDRGDVCQSDFVVIADGMYMYLGTLKCKEFPNTVVLQ